MKNDQFNKIMSRFDGLETKIDANTASIKKLDDRIQNIVDKNDLKE